MTISIDLLEAYALLKPLGVAVGGMAVYGVFVFNFYRFLARKNIFKLDLERYNHARRPLVRKSLASALYVLKFLVLFPAFVFFWFAIVAALLSLMTQNQSPDNILLAAMSVVGAVRVSAYYNEALSTDLAKILPFALLGIMLIDRTLVQLPATAVTIQQAATHWETMAYYLGAVVALEAVLRMLSGVLGLLRHGRSRAAATGPLHAQTADAGRPARPTSSSANGASAHTGAVSATVEAAHESPPLGRDGSARPRLPLFNLERAGATGNGIGDTADSGALSISRAEEAGESFDRLMKSLRKGREVPQSGGDADEVDPFDTLAVLRRKRRG